MKRVATKALGPRQKPLVATKLRPPSNRGTLIRRPRLIETLRETLSRKLALIYGPAGFGKTTLAMQWYAELRAAGTLVAWLAVDASDNDVNRFLGYLVEAVRTADPEMGSGLRELIEANPGGAVDAALDTLVNDLSVHDDHFVVFLDDWHLVHDTRVHDVLHLLLARSPANLHVVITSRTRAGLPLTRLRVQNELVEIDAARLRFDYEESRTYLHDIKSLDLAADDVMALWRSTEGWAAALQLASLSLRDSGDRERIVHWTSGTANDISEYLAENVIATLPEEQVRFMVETSILERLSGDLCAAVTGLKDSAERLDALERQEMFLLPMDEERQWFRYHHLFARFLQRRLKKQMPERVPALHLAASGWFAAHGQPAEAVEHALLAGELPLAVDLVERDAMPLVENSYMSTLLNLVSRLPRTALFDRPRVQMAIAWANCLTHHPQECTEALWHVERVVAATPPEERALLLGEASVIRACSALYGDQGEDFAPIAKACLARAEEYPAFTVGVAANILAYAHLQTYQFDKVGPLMLSAREYQERAQGLFSGVYGRCFDGIASMEAGNLDAARRSFTEAMDLAARTAGRQSHSARLAGALLGQILYEENDLERAERLLKESRVLGYEGGVVDFYVATYLPMCRLMLHRGESDEAVTILQEGEDTARALSLDRLGVAVACERLRVRLLSGDVRGAEQVLSEIDARRANAPSGQRRDVDEVQSRIAVAKARLLCARGTAGAAVRILREQIAQAQRTGWKLLELRLRIVLAVALELDAQPLDAEHVLHAVVEEAIPRGMLRSFLDEGATVVSILERLREKARRRTGGVEDALAFGSSAQRLLTVSRHPEHGILGRSTNARSRVAELTARETEVLRLVDQGRSNKEIARALGLSVDTVKWYLKNIFVKLGVSTRTQAISQTRRLGVFGSTPG